MQFLPQLIGEKTKKLCQTGRVAVSLRIPIFHAILFADMRHHQRRFAYRQRLNLNREISRGLLAILVFIVAILSTLSFFSLAGVAGQFIDSLLAITFGQVRYIFPVVLLIVSALMVKDLEYEYRPTHWLGSLLFFLGFNGTVHLQKSVEEMWSLAMQGVGGGLIGAALAWPLGKYLGYWGALVILTGIMLIAVIFLFNTSLAKIVALHKHAFMVLGWFGKQIISFFALFKRDERVIFKIKGDYAESSRDLAPEDGSAENVTNKTTAEDKEEARVFKHRTLNREEDNEETTKNIVKEEEIIEVGRPKVIIRDLPPLDLLYISKTKPTAGDIKGNAEIIKETLRNFGIDVDMGEVRVGPTVTQYSLKPAKGVKLTRITTLNNDLALALAAHPIRIEAPIPGKSLVGIEVPNERAAIVTLRELLEAVEFKNRPHNMMVALGKDVAGKVWWGDLTKMPHLLIAGATGSGKTVCINAVLSSLLYQNTAATLRMIMVDPKRVELTLYNSIPHLLTPVITDAHKTVSALRWTINEMDRRFNLLYEAGKQNIENYNKIVDEPLPHILFVIDELADLMAAAASEVEAGIIRIAQMARAVGIHLIVATQRPSVDIITGLMKANIPARIAFSVASLIDSRTILDCPGAEKLLGRGDMLYLTAELSKPKRLQGAFVSEEEIKRVVEHLRGDEPPEYDDAIVAKIPQSGTLNLFGGPSDDFDPLFEDAKKIIMESGKASASLLQRRLKLGYARAARLLDELEEVGMVGPADGAKPREVFSEHLRQAEEPEIPVEEQTMDAGGTVFEQETQTEKE